MCGRQSVTHLHRNIQQLARGVDRSNRRAFHVFHDEVVRTYVIQLADVWMVQGRDGARLPIESIRELLFGNFDGDGSVEAGIAGLPDLAHAARAQP